MLPCVESRTSVDAGALDSASVLLCRSAELRAPASASKLASALHWMSPPAKTCVFAARLWPSASRLTLRVASSWLPVCAPPAAAPPLPKLAARLNAPLTEGLLHRLRVRAVRAVSALAWLLKSLQGSAR
jgi:hypothetical protein